MEIAQLPHVLAGLNLASVALLSAGWKRIRGGDKAAHKKMMLAAAGVSIAFLAVYLYYHANSGLAKFGGEGWIRPVYFTILIAHVVFAASMILLVPGTLFLALTGRFETHRRVARWTLPIWLYVSASGVAVYMMAVHLFAYQGG